MARPPAIQINLLKPFHFQGKAKRSLFQSMRSLRIPDENFRKIIGLELVSFVACFGFAMGLLSLHRFPAAIICFSIGCASLSLVVLTVVFSYTNAWWKIASILGTMIATFICMGYLMGLVVQAENEYYEPLIAHEVEMAKNSVHPPHPTPIKKEVIIAPSEQHATQDEVNHPGAIERKSTVLGLCYLPADNSACSIACTVENNGPIVSKNITMGFVGPLPIRIQIASDPEFRVELKKSDTLPIPNQNGKFQDRFVLSRLRFRCFPSRHR